MTSLASEVTATLTAWPDAAKSRFMQIREIIFEVAEREAVGPLIETLKWGQPSWLPQKPRVGSTLRCNWSAARPDHLSLFVNCQTTLLETLREIYPTQFEYQGARALHISLKSPMPLDAIEHCAVLTLKYHRKSA